MTFTLLTIAGNREHILGTIWADGESDARQMATSLFQDADPRDGESLLVRRAEERELPLRLVN